MRIGFLGTGTITSAVVTGIAADAHTITISRRNPNRSTDLAARFGNVSVAENQQVVSQSDFILVGLMAQTAREILPTLTFRPDQIVASFMADMPLAECAALITPAKAEAIVIPFPAIAHGGSPVLIWPPSRVLAQVFGVSNHVVPLTNEAALTTYMAAQALLSPVAKLLAETADWMATRTSDQAGAERFLRILIGGALTAANYNQPSALRALLNDLNTEGGLNAELREFFAAKGVFDELIQGLDQLERRLKL
jgi:pyrroline-5-carboxylate reductase